jgi:hypothetical protein
MQAIQSRGKYAMKFNGGTINVDYFTDWPVDTANVNADYRRWGPCYWSQNIRLLYWNMLTSGDFDLMLPLFDMYCGLLQTQKEMTSAYYGHGGAFFPETLYFHGLYSVEDFGWNNDGVEANSVFIHHYWSGGLEIATMMLDYYEYTNDSKIFTEKLLPFITEAIRFFDQHYGRDENGTIIISPINILETYQKSYENINSTDVLAPLHRMLPRLLKLDVDAKLLNEWSALYNSLPAIPESNDENGINLIKPAYAYNKFRGNGENPELYTLFPYRLYGMGVPETFKTALDSFKYRITPNCACWGQDGIHAAYVGLSDEAKINLIKQFSRTVDDEGAYIGYWKQGDWVPDLDNGGAAATALQSMLIQCYDEKSACIFPAWPKEWNVDFKLYAPNNKIVAGNCTDGNCVVYNLV